MAIYCPITLDQEIGPFLYTRTMATGTYCRPLSEHFADVEVHLHPSDYPHIKEKVIPELIGDIRSNAAEGRSLQYRDFSVNKVDENRPHGVCTVQTFKNPFTGSMLYMFILYYQLMGWR